MNGKDVLEEAAARPWRLHLSKRHQRLLLGAVVVTLAASAFSRTPLAERLEFASLDLRYRHFNRSTSPSEDIVLIDVDEQSLKLLSKTLGRWPWPRQVYADLLRFVAAGEPSGIYFDLLFSEEERGSEGDQRLAAASAEAGRVSHAAMMVLPQAAKDFAAGRHVVPARFLLSAASDARHRFSRLPEEAEPILPVQSYLEQSAGLHVVTTVIDDDGVYRRTPLVFDVGSGLLPSLALRALMDRNPDVSWLEFLRSGRVPLDRTGRLHLHYYRGVASFQVIPIAAVFKSAADLSAGIVRDPALLGVNPLDLRGKIVIIGASAAGLEDLKPTPVDPALPGFVLHATAISNILKQDFLRPTPRALSVLVLTLGILTVYVTLFSALPLGLRFGIVVGGAILYTGAALALFHGRGLHLELATPLSFWWVAGIDSLGYLILVEGREKRRLKEALTKYLSPALAEELIRTGRDPHAEVGSKEELSILFSDIRGFTALSEGLPAERLVQILNQYLERMTRTVFRHQGTLDKFIGDAVMAFWGAPVRNAGHALLAVRTAMDMRSELRQLNEEWTASGNAPLAIGIGVNTGEVIVGNVGSEQRLNYTVIGDQVNLSSRLEGLTKQYGLEIIIGPRTDELVRDHLITRPVDLVRVKGRQEPVRIYEPLWESGAPNAALYREVAAGTTHAFELYLAGRFGEASEAYRLVRERFPAGANLSDVFIERCATLSVHPPPAWDGIFEAKEK